MIAMLPDYQPRLIGNALDAILCRANCAKPTEANRLLRYQTGALLFVGWEDHAARTFVGEHLKHRWALGQWKKPKAKSATITPLRRKG